MIKAFAVALLGAVAVTAQGTESSAVSDLMDAYSMKFVPYVAPKPRAAAD